MSDKFIVLIPKLPKGKGINSVRFEKAVLQRMRAIAGRMTIELYKTSKTWKGERPKFGYEARKTSTGYRLVVHPKDEESMGAKKFMWLDRGTKVRYAVMTKNFKAKTQVRVLDSFPGEGGMAFVNTKIKRPGIKARKWTPEMKKKWRPKMQVELQDTVNQLAAEK